MKTSRKGQDRKELINDFLNSKISGTIRASLHELILRTVERRLKIDTFLKILKKKKFDWKDAVELFKGTNRYKRTAVLFYFLTEFRENIPWAVTNTEFVKEINEHGGKKLNIEAGHVREAFRNFQGGQSWDSVLRDILSERYISSGRRKRRKEIKRKKGGYYKTVPIYWNEKQLFLRILLMGNEVDAHAVGIIKELYRKKTVPSKELTHAKSPLFKIKKSQFVGLHPKLREAVEELMNPGIQLKWKKWKKEKAEFYFEKG